MSANRACPPRFPQGPAQELHGGGLRPAPGAAHQQLGVPIVIVWDNLNTHVSAAMAELIAARDWLAVYQLPPYAHELNPVELVWSHLKRSLANPAKRNLAQLTALVKTRLKRMQYRAALLDEFLASNPHH
jgi:putative transposase